MLWKKIFQANILQNGTGADNFDSYFNARLIA